MKESDLKSLPNIGEKLIELFDLLDIKTPEQLKSLGAENVFIKIRTIEPDACLSKLNAIEGAIQGIRWHYLDKERKKELKEFFDRL